MQGIRNYLKVMQGYDTVRVSGRRYSRCRSGQRHKGEQQPASNKHYY